jgi:hypothetical protein
MSNELDKLLEYHKGNPGREYGAEEFGNMRAGPNYQKPFVGFKQHVRVLKITA